MLHSSQEIHRVSPMIPSGSHREQMLYNTSSSSSSDVSMGSYVGVFPSGSDLPRDKLRNSSMDLFAVSRTSLEFCGRDADGVVNETGSGADGVVDETGSDADGVVDETGSDAGGVIDSNENISVVDDVGRTTFTVLMVLAASSS